MSTLTQVQEIASGFYNHPVSKQNSFFQYYIETPLQYEQLAVVARNFYDHVAPTVDRIALALANMSDVEAKSLTALNIADELGSGEADRSHTRLLSDLFSTLLTKVKGEVVDFDTLALAPLPETIRLVEEGRALFAHEKEEISCGALMAQEWHAYPQLVHLYEGTRNYKHLFGDEEFHENCEYFYIHIGSSEKEHKDQAINAAARICKTDAQIELLRQGFTQYLDLLHAYWTAMHAEVTRLGTLRRETSPAAAE